MFEFIKQVFCSHNWKLIGRGYYKESEYSSFISGRFETYRCTKCLEVKEIEID